MSTKEVAFSCFIAIFAANRTKEFYYDNNTPLRAQYDGYHLCRKRMVDVYNPFSLINALSDKALRNYWSTSGATTLLPKFVDKEVEE